jgi:hypothetical protein
VSPLSAVRIALGATELLAPRALTRAVLGTPLDGVGLGAVRVLGARHLAQAASCAAVPSPTASRLGAAVDALHAASMLALAAFDRRYRRAALTSAAVAGGLAVAETVRASSRAPSAPAR